MVKNQDILLGGKLDEESSEWLKEFVRLKHNEDWDKVIIDTKEGVVKAKILSEVLPQLKEIDSKIQTSERLGNCHQGSLDICSILANPHEIVTGYIYGPSDKAKYIHTWIECLIKEKECVIDYTMNAFMNKEGFYIIKNPEPISRISGQDIKADAKKYGSFLEKINIRQYLLYRDEIIKDLEKNGQFFDEDR